MTNLAGCLSQIPHAHVKYFVNRMCMRYCYAYTKSHVFMSVGQSHGEINEPQIFFIYSDEFMYMYIPA